MAKQKGAYPGDKWFRNFVKERNDAMLSLDERKIRNYCRKYGVPMPANDTVFWAGVHKARIEISAATEEQREESRKWLIEHGFKPDLGPILEAGKRHKQKGREAHERGESD